MYNGLLHAHSGFRWLALISLLITIVLALLGWIGKKEWGKSDSFASLIMMIIMDLQFLIGLILYVFVSPITKMAFKDFGAAMKNADLRFFAVEHLLMMVIALALVHIGRSRTKKDIPGWKKHRVATIFYSLALLIIIAGIPWYRGLI